MGILCYPLWVPLGPLLPQFSHELFTLTGKLSLLMNLYFIDISRLSGAQCQDVAAHLGLPSMPANATIIKRRRQVGDYIGVSFYF